MLFLLSMGRPKCCPRCNLLQAEHTFGRIGKKCSRPVQDEVVELSDEGNIAGQEQEASSTDSNIQASLNSLPGAVKKLNAGLGEVKADNKNLRALVEKKRAAVGTSVSPPTLSADGDDVAQVSKPVSVVTCLNYGLWPISPGKLIVTLPSLVWLTPARPVVILMVKTAR